VAPSALTTPTSGGCSLTKATEFCFYVISGVTVPFKMMLQDECCLKSRQDAENVILFGFCCNEDS
jgi:hypothetical protein